MVKGTHFSKWFKNDQGELKRYAEWKKICTTTLATLYLPFSYPYLRAGVCFHGFYR